MVGSEESHEEWGELNIDSTGSHDIVVSPSLLEVGVEVVFESLTSKSLMGGEDLSSGGHHTQRRHPLLSTIENPINRMPS